MIAVRQALALDVALIFEPKDFQDVDDLIADLALFPPKGTAPPERVCDAMFQVHCERGPYIVVNRQRREEPDVLERACDSAGRDR